MKNKYEIFCNLDLLTREKILESYKRESYKILYDKKGVLIVKKVAPDDYINIELENNIVNFFASQVNGYARSGIYHEDISNVFEKIKEHIAPREVVDIKDLYFRWSIKNALINMVAKKDKKIDEVYRDNN